MMIFISENKHNSYTIKPNVHAFRLKYGYFIIFRDNFRGNIVKDRNRNIYAFAVR